MSLYIALTTLSYLAMLAGGVLIGFTFGREAGRRSALQRRRRDPAHYGRAAVWPEHPWNNR